MSKLKVVVIDDEEDARELVKIQLKADNDIEIVGEADDGLRAITLLDQVQPDIAFLDIQMPELSGIDVATKASHQPYYIFITAYDEFAVRAFELNAIDYLLKPFTKQRFISALERAKQTIKKDQLHPHHVVGLLEDIYDPKNNPQQYIRRLTNKTGTMTEYIDTSAIVAINADNQYVNVITENKEYLLRHSLDYLAEVLDPSLFFRTHRSHIVRLDRILSIEQYEPRNMLIHLTNGMKVKLSQSRKELLNKKMMHG